MSTTHVLGALTLAATITSSQAVTLIDVTVTTNGNVAIAPFLAGFHDGNYDIFNTGDDARTIAGLEELAETGAGPTILNTANTASPNGNFQLSSGPIGGALSSGPPTSRTLRFSVSDGNGFFSIAAMLLASNDWFAANDQADLYDITSLLNAPLGTNTSFSLNEFYDAGTELEDFAFSPGNGLIGVNVAGDAGNGADQIGGLITEITVDNPYSVYSSVASTPAGFDPTALNFTAAGQNFATLDFVVVPEPSSTFLLGLGALAGLARRRR